MNFHPQHSASPKCGKLRRRDAAFYLRENHGFGSVSMLAKLAVTGGGPRMFKYGSRIVLYDPADIEVWVAGRLGDGITSTSQG